MAIPRSITQNSHENEKSQGVDFNGIEFDTIKKQEGKADFYQSSIDDVVSFCCSLISVSSQQAQYFSYPDKDTVYIVTEKGNFLYHETGSFLYANPNTDKNKHFHAYFSGVRTPYQGYSIKLERSLGQNWGDPSDDFSLPQQITEKKSSHNDYVIDPKTGKKHKTLGIQVPGREIKKINTQTDGGNNLGLAEARAIWGENEDFAQSDTLYGGLNSLSKMYLEHLRVPPNEKEIKALREEKKRLVEQQNKDFEDSLKEYIEYVSREESN